MPIARPINERDSTTDKVSDNRNRRLFYTRGQQPPRIHLQAALTCRVRLARFRSTDFLSRFAFACPYRNSRHEFSIIPTATFAPLLIAAAPAFDQRQSNLAQDRDFAANGWGFAYAAAKRHWQPIKKTVQRHVPSTTKIGCNCVWNRYTYACRRRLCVMCQAIGFQFISRAPSTSRTDSTTMSG